MGQNSAVMATQRETSTKADQQACMQMLPLSVVAIFWSKYCMHVYGLPRHWGHFFKGGYNQSLWNNWLKITLLGFKDTARCQDGWLTYLITGIIALPWVKIKILSLLQYLYLTLFFFTVNKLYRQLKHQNTANRVA